MLKPVRSVAVLGIGLSALALAARPEDAAKPSEADIASYRAHISFLADPGMEGRGPGLAGNRRAAEYFERRFKDLGLKPAFESGKRPGGTEDKPSYYQQFTAGRDVKVGESSVSFVPIGPGVDERVEKQSLQIGREFVVLGNSGTAAVEGPIAFVGYSLEAGEGPGTVGPDDASYAEGDDLAGKIALVLRFEPVDGAGHSKLAPKGKEGNKWSPASAISQKIMSAVQRHAAGIILVSPPGVDDERTRRLETPEASAAWTRSLSIPAVMVSQDAAERLLKTADAEKRSLYTLRTVADKGRAGKKEGESAVLLMDRARVRLDTRLERVDRVTWNVGAVLTGSGVLARPYVVIGGHYDHVGLGYQGGSVSNEYGQVHPGADDNASGAAGVLLAAEQLTRSYAAAGAGGAGSPRRSVLFLGFSAEEMGLIGSREFMKAPPIEAGSITGMLNMDMIGRLREGKLELSGTGTAEGFADLLQPLLDASKLTIQATPGGRGPSDHATFYGAGVPVLHFYTGMHAEYHTPRDTVDLINMDGAVRVVDLVTSIATTLAVRAEPLVFTSTDKGARAPSPTPTMGSIKVRFGIAPANYSEEGKGVAVGEVFDGTSAAEAGIKTGDRLIRWNGDPIDGVEGWMGYLARHKPGDVVDVTVERPKDAKDPKSPVEELVVRVTLKARDQAAR